MVGLENAEIEMVVADFIAAEVLRFGRACGRDQRNETHDDRREPNHGHPWAWNRKAVLYHGS
jgi:hypothetical protein